MEAPNKHGLSLDIYKRKFMAEPPRYKSLLHIPGVVFFRAASRKHPMAPTSADYSSSDSETDSGEEEDTEHGRGGLLQRLWRKLKRSTISREDQHRAATVLQGMYRMRAAKRVVYRLKREEEVRARLRATIFIQRMVRAKLQMQKLRKRKAETEQAACIIQKNYRFNKWNREVSSDRHRAHAALTVQTWWRQHLTRENFKILRLRLHAKLASLEKARGLVDLERFLLGYAGRTRARRLRRERQKQNFAALVIQDFMLRFFGNGCTVKQKRMMKVVAQAQEHGVVSRIQRAFRASARYRVGRAMRKHMVARLIQIQCVARRFLARLERWARKRRRESVWAWLSPKVPRGWYEQHLPVPDYEQLFRDELYNIRGGRPPPKEESKYNLAHRNDAHDGPEADKAIAWLKRLEDEFRIWDKSGTGAVTKLEFWRALDVCGIRLKPEFKEYVAEAFVNPMTDSVSWIAYVRFGRSSPGLCPLHRVPVCPECLYIGPCPLSGCKEFRASPNNRFSESSMCACGFHISRHRPALRAHANILTGDIQKSSSKPVDSSSNVARYAFQDPPEMPRPVTPPDMQNSHRVTIQKTEAFTRVRGVDVKVVSVPEEALQVREGQSLKVMQAQRRALKAYLHMASVAARNPIQKEQKRQEEEYQRHKYFYEQALKSKKTKRGALQTVGGGFELGTDSGLLSTIGPDGHSLSVQRKPSEQYLIYESGIEGAGLKNAQYVDAAKMAIHVPLPSAIRTEHFMDLSECAAVSADAVELDSTNVAWDHKIASAKRRELGLMKIESGDLVPGIAGAGKAAASLPYEPADGVGPGQRRGFRITRPVMYIHNGALELTTDSTLLYLGLLHTFAAPRVDGYDILADQQRCIKYCFDHHSFLDQHWDKIVKDIRLGTISVHVKLEKAIRSKIEADTVANPTRAELVEKFFVKLGYKRRAIARAAHGLPINYLKVGKDTAGDPAVLKRKLKITNRERFRHGPRSQLAKLPKVPISSTEEDSILSTLKQTAKSSSRGMHRSKVAKAMSMQSKLAAVVEAAQTAKQVKALGIPTVVVDDADGTQFEFGFIEGATKPYLDLHPGSGAAFTSVKTALDFAKRHSGTHLRTQSAADHFLKSTWEAAGIAEWPGEEVLPEQREFPQEIEVRELLQQHLRKEQLGQEELIQLLPPASEGSLLTSTQCTARGRGSGQVEGLQPQPQTPWQKQAYDHSVQLATERETPAQHSQHSSAATSSPNTNTNMSFQSGWLDRAGTQSEAGTGSTPGCQRTSPNTSLYAPIQSGSMPASLEHEPILYHFQNPMVHNKKLSDIARGSIHCGHKSVTSIAVCGPGLKSPPFQCQEPFKLPGCPHHQWLVPGRLCDVCKAFRKLPLPQPPCTFIRALHLYRDGNIDLGGKNVSQSLNAALPTSAGKSKPSRLSSAGRQAVQPNSVGTATSPQTPQRGINDFIIVHHNDLGAHKASSPQCCVLIEDRQDGYPVLVEYICIDTNGCAWIMGFRLWRAFELAGIMSTRSGFNAQFETVRGSKPVYIKLTDQNVRAIGCVIRTHHIKFFKEAVKSFRINQILAEKGVHSGSAARAMVEKIVQKAQLSGKLAATSCFYFYDCISPATEDACWSRDLVSSPEG